MSGRGGATLRILERADREILKLDRADKGAVYEFQHKFRQNPDAAGLHLKQLKGDSRLWSAYVTKDYRALLLHIRDQDYLLVSVRHRKEVYDNLDRYSYQINQVTGGIEVIDLAAVGDSIVGRVLGAGKPVAPVVEGPPRLFAAYTAEQLMDLGVAQALLPSIAEVTSESQLLELTDNVPQLTADVLLNLYDGKTYEEVLEYITAPVKSDEPVDPQDYAAAAERPATQVTSNDAALRAILAESFARWQVFLHPTQRKLVERHYNGPARVSGGPGTGKTIVALHRVKHLVEKLPPGRDKPILLTTFTRNLAADLRARLVELGGDELVSRVDIVNIDKLASRVVSEAGLSADRRIIGDDRALEEWESLLLELDDHRFTADFLSAEWVQVILGYALASRADYFRVRRSGRGRALSRDERDHIWQLTERLTKRLEDKRVWTLRQVAAAAARLELDRAARIQGSVAEESSSLARHRYRHVVVDEAQDLSAAHWTMLRAMAPAESNDMFLVGDSHQRIYDNYVTLSSLGINIRGRSAKLTLSYRTTGQILACALELLTGETYDDLDGGQDDLAGYRSLSPLKGGKPVFHGARNWSEEQKFVVRQLREWGALDDGSAAISVPTREMVNQVIHHLTDEGIRAVEIGQDGPGQPDGVHVGTMHRFKGLEYQHIAVAGVTEGLVPRSMIRLYRDSDPKRYQRERAKDRSLLFVAATRARDNLVITWHGKPSEFLPPARI